MMVQFKSNDVRSSVTLLVSSSIAKIITRVSVLSDIPSSLADMPNYHQVVSLTANKFSSLF